MAIYEKADNIAPWKWRFWQFVSAAKRHAIDDWRRRAMPQGPNRANMDLFLKRLAKAREWAGSDIGPVKGFPGLTEIGWTSSKVEHRIIGYRLQDDPNGLFQYLMLIGCTHKGRVYDPPDAFATADDRRTKLQKGEATISEYPLLTNR